MKKTAVFGYTGFIGKTLCSYLPNLRTEVAKISVRNENWESAAKDCSIWINLIGKAHDHKGIGTEREYYEANLDVTKTIFQAFIASPANLLIHISSISAVEEFQSIGALTESDVCRPVSWYGKSKRAAEEWLINRILPVDKKIIILRPPMIHGPGDKGNLGLLYKFISKGIPYPLASFENKRSFISIPNFCFFIDQIISNEERLSTGIYHIADDEPISTMQIIQEIKAATGKGTPTLPLPKMLIKGVAKVGDILPIPLNSKRLKKLTTDLLVSNAKIKDALGIEKLPLTAIEGLIKTINTLQHQN